MGSFRKQGLVKEAQEERKAKSINFALDVPKAKPEYSMPTTRPIEKENASSYN